MPIASSFNARMVALAVRQINGKGARVQYLGAAPDAAYDAATLTVLSSAVTPLNIAAVVAPARALGRDGVNEGDLGFLVAAQDLPAPVPGDTIVHAGRSYRVESVDTSWAGDSPVMHLLRGRAD